MPMARDHAASGVIDGKLYVIGGREKHPSNPLNVNEEYEPTKDEWVTKAPMPTSRGGIVATLSDSIYVFCGETDTRIFANTEEYVPSLDTWIVREEMPSARHGCAAAEVDGGIYVISGSTVPGVVAFSPSTKNEVFTPVN